MLNVVEPIVAAGDQASFIRPSFDPRIGGVDADVDHFGLLDTPFANDAEALTVPVRIGDQVDRYHDPERAGEFERLEADEHVFETELSPEAEHLLVAQQHVAAGLEVILLADAGPDDRLADRHPVALLHECDVVDDEHTRLADRPQVLDDALRADRAIAAAVERPGAAKGAVPWAAPRELDRGARIERAEKISSAMAQEVARRHQIIE